MDQKTARRYAKALTAAGEQVVAQAQGTAWGVRYHWENSPVATRHADFPPLWKTAVDRDLNPTVPTAFADLRAGDVIVQCRSHGAGFHGYLYRIDEIRPADAADTDGRAFTAETTVYDTTGDLRVDVPFWWGLVLYPSRVSSEYDTVRTLRPKTGARADAATTAVEES